MHMTEIHTNYLTVLFKHRVYKHRVHKHRVREISLNSYADFGVWHLGLLK